MSEEPQQGTEATPEVGRELLMAPRRPSFRLLRRVVLYHLVPAIPNPMLSGQFLQGMPEGTIVAKEGLLFELPRDSEVLESRQLFDR